MSPPLPPVKGASEREPRAQPVGDYKNIRGMGVVQRRTMQREHQLHLVRLASVRGGLDNKTPAAYRHVKLNAKKAMQIDEHYEAIEKSNRNLLGRLQNIMVHDQGHAPPLPGVRAAGPTSLNRSKRLAEQNRLAAENEHLVRRIMLQKPVYSAVQMEEDYAHTRVYSSLLALMPPPRGLGTSVRDEGSTVDGARSSPALGLGEGSELDGAGRRGASTGKPSAAAAAAAAAAGRRSRAPAAAPPGRAGKARGGGRDGYSLAELQQLPAAADLEMPPALSQVGLVLLQLAADDANGGATAGLELRSLVATFNARVSGLSEQERAAMWADAQAQGMSASEAALLIEDFVRDACAQPGIAHVEGDEITVKLPTGVVAYERGRLLDTGRGGGGGGKQRDTAGPSGPSGTDAADAEEGAHEEVYSDDDAKDA